MILLDVGMGVPLQVARTAPRDDADESNAMLDELARQQATPAVIMSPVGSHAIQVKRFPRLARQVEDVRSLGLHLERKVVSVDPRRELLVGWIKRRAIQPADESQGLSPPFVGNP